ncbi:hypothetical protein CU254_37455 [Amycolatopsis sp. AA4]|uniref:hypothetical protein n=1 Tax=Actinomycetes TaxID=1760 RepID=UPI0001B53B7E|nr:MULTISPECIES: hypothetical protein [Actinomycetes]ATY15444.1 hypothetical protein CU254_37455 [Amycolatopsis sp. AA4]
MTGPEIVGRLPAVPVPDPVDVPIRASATSRGVVPRPGVPTANRIDAASAGLAATFANPVDSPVSWCGGGVVRGCGLSSGDSVDLPVRSSAGRRNAAFRRLTAPSADAIDAPVRQAAGQRDAVVGRFAVASGGAVDSPVGWCDAVFGGFAVASADAAGSPVG